MISSIELSNFLNYRFLVLDDPRSLANVSRVLIIVSLKVQILLLSEYAKLSLGIDTTKLL